MNYTIQDISKIIVGKLVLNDSTHAEIRELLTDSREIISPETSLFFAFKGARHDGHRFVDELIRIGVKNFVVSKLPEKNSDRCNFILVDDALAAMQKFAAHHRSQFNIPVIGKKIRSSYTE